MHLALPPQTDPDTGSFPQDRDAVRTWMEALSPVAEPDDADEFLRGLRHSNRLVEFRPTLNALTTTLTQTVTPQPLPMAAPFQRASVLLGELLREEAITWKILLAHSERPSTCGRAAIQKGAPQLHPGRQSNLCVYRVGKSSDTIKKKARFNKRGSH